MIFFNVLVSFGRNKSGQFDATYWLYMRVILKIFLGIQARFWHIQINLVFKVNLRSFD